MGTHELQELRAPFLSRRMMLASATGLAPVIAGLQLPRAEADPANVGSWTDPFDLGGVAIHATLLHTDDVLIFQYVEGNPTVDHTSWIATWNWKRWRDGAPDATTEAAFLYERDIFCTGHNVLADGRLFIAGGHDHTTGHRQDVVGTDRCDIYDPETRTWTEAPRLTQKRWYPTNVGLGNGRALVFGGLRNDGRGSTTVDEYDPTTDEIRPLPVTHPLRLGNYPRMHLMPDGRVLTCGPRSKTALFNPATGTWRRLPSSRQGTRWEGTTALLSGGKRVLIVGGGEDRHDRHPTGTTELLDLDRSHPEWRFTGSLRNPRFLHNLVLLPDGKALAVGGGTVARYERPVYVPEMYDPRTGRWSVMKAQHDSRMYHSTALLLPDGRVFSAGQTHGEHAQWAEIFSPPYLFRGTQPEVTESPERVPLGGRLEFSTRDDAERIAKVTLMRPSSVTHGNDTEQRAVPLQFTASGTTVTARVPGNRNLVPPGYYMLFTLNRAGAPAIRAPWVRIV